MFGYIRVNRPELKVREDVLYKALYCGQCKAQKVCTGQCSRLTLSYDFVFIALARMALTHEKPPQVHMKRCIMHPLRRRPIADRSPALDDCAYAAALLTYHKIQDDRMDEKGKKRLLATLAAPFANSARNRALKASEAYAKLDKRIEEQLDAIHEIEQDQLPTADRPAELFGQAMADILLCHTDVSAAEQKLGASLGLHVGRWVYLIDALDDFDEDLQKDRYNPFACLYGKQPLTPEHREQIRMALYREISELERTLDLLELDENSETAGILYNIVTKGMPTVTEEVLAGRFHASGKHAHGDARHTEKGTKQHERSV